MAKSLLAPRSTGANPACSPSTAAKRDRSTGGSRSCPGAVLVLTLNVTWVTTCAAVVLGPPAGAPSRPHLRAGASSRGPICTAGESGE
jgi:hypothetical protein